MDRTAWLSLEVDVPSIENHSCSARLAYQHQLAGSYVEGGGKMRYKMHLICSKRSYEAKQASSSTGAGYISI